MPQDTRTSLKAALNAIIKKNRGEGRFISELRDIFEEELTEERLYQEARVDNKELVVAFVYHNSEKVVCSLKFCNAALSDVIKTEDTSLIVDIISDELENFLSRKQWDVNIAIEGNEYVVLKW